MTSLDAQLLDKDRQIAQLTAQIESLKSMALKSAALEAQVIQKTEQTTQKVEQAISAQKSNEEDTALVIIERDELRKKYEVAKDDIAKLSADLDTAQRHLETARKENASIAADLAKQKADIQKSVSDCLVSSSKDVRTPPDLLHYIVKYILYKK